MPQKTLSASPLCWSCIQKGALSHSPNRSAGMGNPASPWHADTEGPPAGTQHGTDHPHPIAGTRKRQPTTPRKLANHNSWWQMVGHPGQAAPMVAAAKACLVKGHRARGSMTPGWLPGDRMQEPCRREGSTLSVTLAAASSWQPPAWPAASPPAHIPPHAPPRDRQIAKSSLSMTEDKENMVLQGWSACSPRHLFRGCL